MLLFDILLGKVYEINLNVKNCIFNQNREYYTFKYFQAGIIPNKNSLFIFMFKNCKFL